MNPAVDTAIRRLEDILASMRKVAVAVSGGVDSVTLAVVAQKTLGDHAAMFHAVSPAVPPEATARTRKHARQQQWRLQVIDAGEFADPDYLKNPINRCFYCKKNLYSTISAHTDYTVVSGTNTDDLTDFRPGLEAASDHKVQHPYVDADIDKQTVRRIAARLGLEDVADLPASPCLSSRIETGIRVEADALRLVHAVENLVRADLGSRTVRCRVRSDGLVVELDAIAFEKAQEDAQGNLHRAVESLGAERGFVGDIRFEPYRMGSAFLRN